MRASLEALTLPGPAGALEALAEAVEGASGFAVVCHPHPQHGGTMHNKVVHTLARALQKLGLSTLRFNYRGVGSSAGSYDEGRGECEDALAVVQWGQTRWPGQPLTLGGFSFGAMVSYRAALRTPTARLISVAPAVSRPEFSDARPACPWLVIQGEADEIVDYRAVQAWVAHFSPPPTLRLLAGVSHFFHGRLGDLEDAVLQNERSPGSFDRPGS